MTLLQTRVDEQTARRFDQVAREHGLTSYSYLQQLATEAARQPTTPEGWEGHRERLAALKNKPLPYNTVAHEREEGGER